MSCERCGGLMVIETFCDLMEEESRTGIETIRCLNCGNFEDTIIRTNRFISRVPRHGEPHTVGTRRLSASQPRSLERAIQTGRGGRAECPGRPSSCKPSANTDGILELNHAPVVQTKGGAYEKHTSLCGESCWQAERECDRKSSFENAAALMPRNSSARHQD